MRQKTSDKIHRKDAKNTEKNHNGGEKTKGKRHEFPARKTGQAGRFALKYYSFQPNG